MAKETPQTGTMRSSYNQTTAASSNMLGGHRHMMTFGDIKTNSNMTPAKSVDCTSWAEVQQNSKSPKPAYMRAGEIAEA